MRLRLWIATGTTPVWSPRCVSSVILPRQRHSTLILMTALVVICSAVPALWLGFSLGRRAGATKPTAKTRSRRAALATWTARVFALMIITRMQRSMQRSVSAERARALSRLRALSFLPQLSKRPERRPKLRGDRPTFARSLLRLT